MGRVNGIVDFAPREGHCQRAWPVLQDPSVVLLRWLREDPISWSEPSTLYRHLLTTLTLVTHHLVLHKPL